MTVGRLTAAIAGPALTATLTTQAEVVQIRHHQIIILQAAGTAAGAAVVQGVATSPRQRSPKLSGTRLTARLAVRRSATMLLVRYRQPGWDVLCGYFGRIQTVRMARRFGA